MLTFQPALWRDGTYFDLPRPITTFRIQDGWDIDRFKIPLVDGDTYVGHSRNGIDIAIEGQFGTRSDGILPDELAMLAAIEEFRQALEVAGEEDQFQLVLYRDQATGGVRAFRQCSPIRFESDLTQKQLFTYSLVIHACDPTLYSTLD